MRPTNKNFGYTFSTIFFLLSILFFSKEYLFYTLLTLSIIFLILTKFFLKSSLLTYLNGLWFKFGTLLATVLNPTIMFLFYFLIFFPFSLIIKVFNVRLLEKKIIKENKTYWIKKNFIITNLKKQF
jgi:hypothetical protein